MTKFHFFKKKDPDQLSSEKPNSNPSSTETRAPIREPLRESVKQESMIKGILNRLDTKTKIVVVVALIIVIAIIARGIASLFSETPSETIIQGTEESGSFDSAYWNSAKTETKPSASSDNSMTGEQETVPDIGSHSLYCVILDVGQGSCTILESGGEYVVIDTGDTDHAQVPVAYLKKIGVSEIKYIINTHWDNDHCGATLGLYKNFTCGPLIGADYVAETRTYQSVHEQINEGFIEFIVPKIGDIYQFGSCRILVNGPVRYDYEEENSNSISMIVTDGYSRMYIGGDTTIESEADILATGADVDCDIYLCNHHGSSTSTSAEFVRAMTPNDTIISCGKDNDYGHPARRVLKTLQESGTSLYRTDMQGDIILTFYGNQGYRFEEAPCDDWTPGVYKPAE